MTKFYIDVFSGGKKYSYTIEAEDFDYSSKAGYYEFFDCVDKDNSNNRRNLAWFPIERTVIHGYDRDVKETNDELESEKDKVVHTVENLKH